MILSIWSKDEIAEGAAVKDRSRSRKEILQGTKEKMGRQALKRRGYLSVN